jgi:hypothetical protein
MDILHSVTRQNRRQTGGQAMTPQPTTEDLRREYHAAHLWAAGVTLAKALNEPLIRKGLELAARAHRRPNQPTQGRLL